MTQPHTRTWLIAVSMLWLIAATSCSAAGGLQRLSRRTAVDRPQAGTCIRPRKSASRVFRQTGGPTGGTAPRPSARWSHLKGSFYHDGRFASLNAVVDHYNTCMSLALSPDEKNQLVNYLLSLTF